MNRSVQATLAVVSSTAVLALGGCQTPVQPVVEPAVQVDSQRLQTDPPVDVVILPVEDATVGKVFTGYAEPLRESLSARLADLNYTPVRNRDYVDQRLRDERMRDRSMVDASALEQIRGLFEEDALLGVRINRWDISKIDDRRPTTGFSFDLRLIDSRTGAVLASGTIDGIVPPTTEGVTPTTRKGRLNATVRSLGNYLLDTLPTRPKIEGPEPAPSEPSGSPEGDG